MLEWIVVALYIFKNHRIDKWSWWWNDLKTIFYIHTNLYSSFTIITFCGTWYYLPHSQVYNERIVSIIMAACKLHESSIFPLPLLNLTSTSCSSTPISFKTRKFRQFSENFANSAIIRIILHISHCACAKRPYFHFRSKIWRNHRVPRLRFL